MTRRARHARRAQRRGTALVPLGVLLLVAAMGTASALAGAYGVFTSSASANVPSVVGGTVGLIWNDSTADGARLTELVGPLFPADTVQHTADLRNSGDVSIRQLHLTISGVGTGTTSDGIQLTIDRCSTAWIANASVFTCPGTITSVSPDRPVQGTIALSDSAAADVGGLDHLRFTFRLPDTAPSSAEGITGSLLIIATGTT